MNLVALLLTLLVGLFILLGSFIGLNYKNNKDVLKVSFNTSLFLYLFL